VLESQDVCEGESSESGSVRDGRAPALSAKGSELTTIKSKPSLTTYICWISPPWFALYDTQFPRSYSSYTVIISFMKAF